MGCGAVTPAEWVNLDGSWNARFSKFPFLRKFLGRLHIAPEQLLRIPWNSKVVIHDVRKPLPFPAESAEAIYASHLLDCLYLHETQRLLKECFRVLKPGGILRVVVEDVRGILEEYLEKKPSPHLSKELAQLRPVDRLMARLLCQSPAPMAGSFLYRLYRKTTDFQTRKWAYDADSLIFHLQEAGFSDVAERKWLESRIPGIEVIEKSRGICVEGIRSAVRY